MVELEQVRKIGIWIWDWVLCRAQVPQFSLQARRPFRSYIIQAVFLVIEPIIFSTKLAGLGGYWPGLFGLLAYVVQA